MKLHCLIFLFFITAAGYATGKNDTRTALEWYSSETERSGKPPAKEYGEKKDGFIQVGLFSAVEKEGIYFIPAFTTLTKAIEIAGGRTRKSQGGDLMICRNENGKMRRILCPNDISKSDSIILLEGDVLSILWFST